MAELHPASAWTDKRVEMIVGNLLRAGVILAAVVVLIGGLMYLAKEGAKRPDYQKFDPAKRPDLHSASGIVRDAVELRPRGVIALGLLLLIATPVVRVIFTVFAFFMEHDYAYVVVTLIVLAGLLFSLFFGNRL